MGQQRNATTNAESSSRDGWTGLMNSMIGLTNAAAMFSIQQAQNAFSIFTDSRGVLNRFKRAIDSISHAMNNEIDDSKRSTVDQMNRAGTAAVNATADTLSSDDSEDTASSETSGAFRGRKR